MLGVMHLHACADGFLDLCGYACIAYAEAPGLGGDAAVVQRELALLGLAEPAAAREFLQHA